MSEECKTCGVGEYLPSRVCDHCDSKADDHPGTPRPIATAPKDGSRLLLFYDGLWAIGTWAEPDGWMDDDLEFVYNLEVDAITHWLPLPPAPSLV